jgi:hypothetical protein
MALEPHRKQRTYFNHPLVDESLQCLPAALTHGTPEEFRNYVIEHVPQNSLKGRKRIAGYLLQRFSQNGQLNLPLAAAVARFGDSRASREILLFELFRVYPLFAEIATHWLAELPGTGGSRDSLKEFLAARIPGRSTEKVAKDSLTTLTQCGKVSRVKVGWYTAVWSRPPLEVFLYVLAALYPKPAVVPVAVFAGQPILRALLWPPSSIEELLSEAERAGHISKISQLDQYHQFTLAGSGRERLERLLPNVLQASGQGTLFDLYPEVTR